MPQSLILCTVLSMMPWMCPEFSALPCQRQTGCSMLGTLPMEGCRSEPGQHKTPFIRRGMSWGSAISPGSLWAQSHVVTYTASQLHPPWPHSRTWGGSPRVGSMAGSLSPEHASSWMLGYTEVPCLGACTLWVQSQGSRAGALPSTQSHMRQGAGQERSSSTAPHPDPAQPAQPLIQPPFIQHSPSPSTAPHPTSSLALT